MQAHNQLIAGGTVDPLHAISKREVSALERMTEASPRELSADSVAGAALSQPRALLFSLLSPRNLSHKGYRQAGTP
jgi:hypothetical protein